MNEPANFVDWIENPQDPLAYVEEQAVISGNPPNRTSEPPAPGTPAFAGNLTRRAFDLDLKADSLIKRQAPGASQPLGLVTISLSRYHLDSFGTEEALCRAQPRRKSTTNSLAMSSGQQYLVLALASCHNVMS